jgi:serine/threonine-protein kinase
MKCPRCEQPFRAGASECGHCGCSFDLTLDSELEDGASAPLPAEQPAASFEPGERVGGRYRIVGLVGRGGMGEVYRADDLKLGQTVALKFLPAAFERDPDRVERLLTEVRLARQVAHPNACRVFDASEVDGRHFLSMEFVDGEDLASLLRRIGRLSADKAAQVGRQICAGLAAAHEQGILHRDLKPANVMLDGRGRAKITDFGLAIVGADSPEGRARVGTPAYMAPEQHEGGEFTARSDIYALGLVLYELFTGNRLVDDDTLRSALDSGTAPEISDSRSWPLRLDPAVEGVIHRCLERDPARRPASALAVAAALPGGDPLAAALAAGDTPSPDMVAEAGSTEGLTPKWAGAWMALLVSALLLQPWLKDQSRDGELLGATKPPAVMADRTSDLLDELGLSDATESTKGWYYWDDSAAAAFGGSESVGPSRLRHGRRVVPEGGLPNPRRISAWHDPSPDLPGSRRIVLSPRGRVLYLDATLAPELEPLPPVDWEATIALLALDDLGLVRAEPQLFARGQHDERRAWEGSWPDEPELSVRVEAAALGGRLVWLETVMGGVRSGAALQPRAVTAGMSPVTAVIYFLLPAIAACLAWRNHRVRRTDARGAALFLAIVLVGHVAVMLVGREVHASARMLSYIRAGLGAALYMSTVAWLYYLAVEPIVRRWWPDVLIGWSRLAATRRMDARLGREVLVGLAVGAFLSAVRSCNPLLSSAIGWEVPAIDPRQLLNGGATQIFAAAIHDASDGFLYAMVFLFVAAVSRLTLRRAWPLAAGPVVLALMLFLETGARTNPATFATSAVCTIVVLVLISRFGLLAAFACTGCYVLLEGGRTTLNPEIWSFGARLMVLAALAALGLFAAQRSLRHRPAAPNSLSS